jgi:HlyD family secretion protein
VFKVVDGRTRLTEVTIGDGDDRFRTMETGLAAGDKVILFPGDALRDGDAVQATLK